MARPTVIEDQSPIVISQPTEAWYHFGMLPASGNVLYPVPSDRNGKMELRSLDPWDLWGNASGLEAGLHIWTSKLRQHVGLSVRGFHFPSTNEYVEMSRQETSRVTYAGGMARMTNDQVNAVIASCFKRWVRFPFGSAKMEDPTQNVRIIDAEHGAKPANFSDAEWSAYKRQYPVPEPETFNLRTDKYVAEFVYLSPVKVETEVDEQAYAKNPNKLHYQILGPITHEWFANPPKSIAEMYPQRRV